jgi:sugar O-acyltransferase (sialic acid O-acetyltransferase NeuD family)
MSHELIIIGAAGHAAVVAQAAEASAHRVIAFLADAPSCVGLSVAGPVASLASFLERNPGAQVFIAIGDNATRRRIAEGIRESLPACRFATVIHPSAVICEPGSISPGAFVGAGAVVGVGARVGEFAIMNTRACLTHPGVLGAFPSRGPGSATGGDARIGEGAHLGMGAMVHHGVSVGDHAILGSLSLANRIIPACEVWMGNPARMVREREPGESYL